MQSDSKPGLPRRDFLTRSIPACAVACLGLGKLLAMTGTGDTLNLQDEVHQDEGHRFDTPLDRPVTYRQRIALQHETMIRFIKHLRTTTEEKELITMLKGFSADNGRQVGERQAEEAADTTFGTFVEIFRPPNYQYTLTHEIVEDTDKAFQLRVTECLWANTYNDAEVGGEIGHAAICNMDYYWPTAFNPAFKMERDRTLMQGHDQCNHRYLDTS
ncbi:L-2-amino-thiazoline-4-carboxylic acid hydrolase [Candidatus Neomarinimicrobiota bacterium]